MPLYTVTSQAGQLRDDVRAKLASELTALHSEYAGVPKNWVHVIFLEYARGCGFTAGEPAATASLTLLIRTGRSAEYKRELLTRLWKLIQTTTGAADEEEARQSGYSRPQERVYLVTTPPSPTPAPPSPSPKASPAPATP